MTEQKMFVFNPQDMEYTNVTDNEIISYYENVSKKIRKEIKEDIILNNIDCSDNMREFIDISISSNITGLINKDLEGKQKDCPKPGKRKVLTHKEMKSNGDDEEDENEDDDVHDHTQIQVIGDEVINKTKEFMKKLLPLLCCIMKTTNDYNIENRLYKEDKYSKIIDSNIFRFVNKILNLRI